MYAIHNLMNRIMCNNASKTLCSLEILTLSDPQYGKFDVPARCHQAFSNYLESHMYLI